jgi:hypothetical protein
MNKNVDFLVNVFFTAMIVFADEIQPEVCWLQTKGRGIGVPVSTCATGLEKSGPLCYPPCPDGDYHYFLTKGSTSMGPLCLNGTLSGIIHMH